MNCRFFNFISTMLPNLQKLCHEHEVDTGKLVRQSGTSSQAKLFDGNATSISEFGRLLFSQKLLIFPNQTD